jgi:hypothetical protein
MSHLPIDTSFHAVPCIIPGITQAVAVASTHAECTAFNAATTFVELIANTNCWILFGASPTAAKPTTTAASGQSSYLPSGVFRMYGVTPGQKVSVIRDTADGFLSVNEAL